VVFGESHVACEIYVREKKENRWADRLANMINQCQAKPVEYHNKGIGGSVISPRCPDYESLPKPSALERYKNDVIAQNPDLFVFSFGLNDMRSGTPLDIFVEDAEKIITDVQEKCAPVIVITTVYFAPAFRDSKPGIKGSLEATLKYNEAIEKLAEKHNCILADIWTAEGQTEWIMYPDGIHANFVGHMMIANCVFNAIARNCSALTCRVHAEDKPGWQSFLDEQKITWNWKWNG
jgi:lysophospholipase L1-like esterase